MAPSFSPQWVTSVAAGVGVRCSPESFGSHIAVTQSRDRQGLEGSEHCPVTLCADTDYWAMMEADDVLAAVVRYVLVSCTSTSTCR